MKLNQSAIKKAKKSLNIAIILPRFNDELGGELLQNVIDELAALGVKSTQLYRVPGALELPYATFKIAKSKKYDAIIALGIIIRGKTKHFDLVSEVSHQGLMEVNLDEDVPVIFGILAVENEKQAVERVRANKMNKGAEFARAAVEMAQFRA